MAAPPLLSTLRRRRAALGLSQAALAERVGVSRQALSAIEAGRQVPSTALALQLARALGCGVDDLFALPGGPVLHARLAAEARPGARLTLGRVDGAWVAHPCPGDRAADGALLGPASPDAGPPGAATVELHDDPSGAEANALVGGCAPLLGVLAERLGRRYRDARATWVAADSGRALDLLGRGLLHVAGLHLAAASDLEVHAAAACAAFPDEPVELVHLARWRQGLVVAPGNPLGIRGPADLLRPDVRCARRAPGAGAQRLLERALAEVGGALPPADAARAPVAADHAEVAHLVRWGVVDAGVAIEGAALEAGLDFLPLAEERFDLVVPRARLDAPPVARFLALLDAPAFRAEAARFPGYDLARAGHASTVRPDTVRSDMPPSDTPSPDPTPAR
ncbi:MAG TPA: substrate-binding domain-containing protein [Polyangiaceae bacterium LLY-WYZ-15_(1-7)]|nr:substrate-binding domain-containing protein [Polyangiaceae bacterium LLY-WYZ-15_(1-7)]